MCGADGLGSAAVTIGRAVFLVLLAWWLLSGSRYRVPVVGSLIVLLSFVG